MRVCDAILAMLRKETLQRCRCLVRKWPDALRVESMDRATLEQESRKMLVKCFDMCVQQKKIASSTAREEAVEHVQQLCPVVLEDKRHTMYLLLSAKTHPGEPHANAPTRLEQYCCQLADFFGAFGRYPSRRDRRQKGEHSVLAERRKRLHDKSLKVRAMEAPSAAEKIFLRRVEELPCWYLNDGSVSNYISLNDLGCVQSIRSCEAEMVQTWPDTCWLCGRGYMCTSDLARHCENMHGNYAEYRKRVLFLFRQRGVAALSGEEKRAMIQNAAQFQVSCVPGSGTNDWPSGAGKFRQRQEHACGVCARLNYLEDMTEVCLFGGELLDGQCDLPQDETNDGETLERQNEDQEVEANSREQPRIRNIEAVDALLSVTRYRKRWPLIPSQELFASSVVHPASSAMAWVLHTRVIAVQEGTFGVKSGLSDEHGCAGVGDPDVPVWLCQQCCFSLCRRVPSMPPAALCNDMWIGRLPTLFSGLSQSEKWLLSLGRPCWRKVLLGRRGVPDDEKQAGLLGNSVLLAQPTAGLPSRELPPDVDMLRDTLVIVFAGSGPNNLDKAKWATVRRSKYLEAARHRQKVCPAFAQISVNEQKCDTMFAEESIPEVVKQCAVEVPEVAEVQQFRPGLAGDGFVGHSCETESGEDSGGENGEQCSVQQAVCESSIAVNQAHDEDPASMFATVQAKLQILQDEAAKIAENESAAKLEHDGAQYGCTDEGGRQVCREIVVDLQSALRKMGSEGRSRLEQAAMESQYQRSTSLTGLAIPTNEPLSFYHPSTWPACFPEFLYGDGVPNIDRDCPLTFEELFAALINRQELQYTVPGELVAFKSLASNRFATPEMIAIFADVRRRLALLSSARAVICRAGFGQDLKLIAEASASDFAQALDILGPRGTVQEAARHPETSKALKAALRTLMVCTANIPGTDGRKMVQRHIGHAMNLVYGPCMLFVTFNFADTRSKLVHKLYVDAGSDPDEIQLELLDDDPHMPSLRDMHRLVAQNPRVQSKFFLFMLSTHVRHVLGIDDCWWGRHKVAKPAVPGKEDNACASLRPCLLPFPVACMGPGESQERGFEHAHIKVHGLSVVDARRLRQLLKFPDEDLRSSLAKWRAQAVEYASSLLQESATWTASSFGLQLPQVGFSAEQQRQTRFDGGEEEDGKQRVHMPVVASEADGHIEREKDLASIERREARGVLDTPLTGCCNSQLPTYRLPASFGKLAQHASGAVCPQEAQPSDMLQPRWGPRQGEGLAAMSTQSGEASQDRKADAALFARAFAQDARRCFQFNQMHRCVESCVKYVRSKASRSDQVQKNRAPLCRAGFYHIVEIALTQNERPAVTRKRRRGKMLRTEPCIDEEPSSKTFGRVLLKRDHPFISVSSDVAQVAARCNVDVQYLELFPPEDASCLDESSGKLSWLEDVCPQGQLSDIARGFAAVMAHMFRAMHNCDYYITKYVAKPLQSMKSLIEQMKEAMVRMEGELLVKGGNASEQAQQAQTGAEQHNGAKRTLLKIAHAANRCYWQSATELCTILMTGGDMLQSHVVQTVSRHS